MEISQRDDLRLPCRQPTDLEPNVCVIPWLVIACPVHFLGLREQRHVSHPPHGRPISTPPNANADRNKPCSDRRFITNGIQVATCRHEGLLCNLIGFPIITSQHPSGTPDRHVVLIDDFLKIHLAGDIPLRLFRNELAETLNQLPIATTTFKNSHIFLGMA